VFCHHLIVPQEICFYLSPYSTISGKKFLNNSKFGQSPIYALEISDTEVPTGDQLPAEYVVKKGNSLWNISEQAYGSGYNWVDVYAANKTVIKNPDVLLAGSKITLPKVEKKEITYQVKKGDNLWNIAAAYCGSGFSYPKIASANQIKDAGVIDPGKILEIVCN